MASVMIISFGKELVNRFIFPGFVQRCFDDPHSDCNVLPYPMTIYPSPYPREDYQRAYRMQYGINQFVQRLAYDLPLMDSIFVK